MENKNFKNLNDFFGYLEFCPLCKNRLEPIASVPSTSADFNGRELIFEDSDANFAINLFNNTVSDDYLLSKHGVHTQIVLKNNCPRYHFFYNGIGTISKYSMTVKDILLDKTHMIVINSRMHFVINNSILSESTNIRMTNKDAKVRQLELPFINFDLTSKKKINDKLRNICLLG